MTTLPPGVRRAFRLASGRPPVEEEVDAEVAFHLEMRAAELEARGWTSEAAGAEARRRFGNIHQWSAAMSAVDRERVAQHRRAEWLGELRQDLRFGVRALRRAPLFALLAIVTLALGIGANAAVFGVVKSVLLDALPYAEAGRLVSVYGRMDGSPDPGTLSAGTVGDIAERQRSFERLAAFDNYTPDAVYGGDDGPRVAKIAWVTPHLFRTLGVPAALGRTFHDDDPTPDTARVVLLTHAAWQRLFAGDPGVVGRDARVNGIPRRVIGVLPREFVGPAGKVDFYFALDLGPTLRDPVRARRRHWLGLVARLKPGVTHEAAQRDLAAIGAALVREHPVDNAGRGLAALPLRDAMVGDTRTPLLVLLASAGLVLLIACANLAGALLSRTLSRRTEFAVRASLGAPRGRLVRQLLAESTVLALAGGGVGILLAVLGLAVLRGLALPALPAYAELALDPGAVLVTVLLALGTGLGFGLAPALSVGRANQQAVLRDEARGATGGRRSNRLRGVLVAGQVALCVSLLAGAGLLTRSLWALTASPLGFEPDGVLSAAVQLPNRDYASAEARGRFHDQFLERLRGIPGVVSAASVSALPTAVDERNSFTIVGAPWPDRREPFVLYGNVSDDYFRTLGIPLRRGRAFDARDHADAPLAVVISETMARRYWPGGDALGARIRIGPDPEAPPHTVVGIAGDVRNDPARPDAEPMTYVSRRQNPWDAQTFLLRTTGDPRTLAQPVQQALRALAPGVPLHDPVTLRGLLADRLAGRRLPATLMATFGVLALVLASVGVYAMFAALAAAREREFGVRVALGSSRHDIARLVLRQGGGWMALGLAGGAAGIVLVARALQSLLYGVAPFDPVALGLAVAVLLACAVVALLGPVRRATRVDPITVLR